MKLNKRGLGQARRRSEEKLVKLLVALVALPFKLAWWIISLPFKLLFGGSKKKT